MAGGSSLNRKEMIKGGILEYQHVVKQGISPTKLPQRGWLEEIL